MSQAVETVALHYLKRVLIKNTTNISKIANVSY